MKMILGYHFHLSDCKTNKFGNTLCWWGWEKADNLILCCWEGKQVQSLSGDVWTNNACTIWLAPSTSGNLCCRYLCTCRMTYMQRSFIVKWNARSVKLKPANGNANASNICIYLWLTALIKSQYVPCENTYKPLALTVVRQTSHGEWFWPQLFLSKDAYVRSSDLSQV